MTLRLHDYEASANCYKVRLLLSQLGRDYEKVPVDIFAGQTLTEEYASMNPGLTTPVLEFEPGRYLPESGAILLFLAEGSEFLPGDTVERADVHRWLFFEQNNILPVIGALRFRMLTGRIDSDGEEAQRQKTIAGAIVGAVEGHLASHEFASADRYTVADVALYGYLHVAHEAGVDMSVFANVGAWLDRVREQPGHVADLEPYPANAQPGQSNSIYDMLGII